MMVELNDREINRNVWSRINVISRFPRRIKRDKRNPYKHRVTRNR